MRALLLLLTALMVVLARSASAQSRKTSSGDIHAADLNDKSVQRVLNFIIREYNKDISKDEYYSRPLQVMAAYQQVGAATTRGILSPSWVCCPTPGIILSKSTLSKPQAHSAFPDCLLMAFMP